MVDEWEAQNILTSSIAYDILGLTAMGRVHCYLKPQTMGWNHPFFTWFWVYYPPKINGGRMGGPKYLD
jgi:hypothetical protein